MLRWCDTFLELGVPESGTKMPDWIQEDHKGSLVALIQDMRKDYAAWAETEGERAVSSVNFTKSLNRWGASKTVKSGTSPFKYERRKIKGIKIGIVFGVKWRSESEF